MPSKRLVCRVCNGGGSPSLFRKDAKYPGGYRGIHKRCLSTRRTAPGNLVIESEGGTITAHATMDDCSSIEAFIERIGQPRAVLDPQGESEFVVERVRVRREPRPSRDGTLRELYHFGTELRRRVPLLSPGYEPIEQVSVINCTGLPRPKRNRPGTDTSILRCVVIPDTQFGYIRDPQSGVLDPFHDRRACDVVLQIIEEYQPHLIIHLGDLMDLPEWTDKFFRSPDMSFTTRPALRETRWWLEQWKNASKACDAFKIIEGNHDARLWKALGKHLPAAWGLDDGDGIPVLSIPKLLRLEEAGIEYLGEYPNGEFWINDNLRTSHGEIYKTGSGETTKAVLGEARNSEIMGHIHRCEIATKTAWGIGGPTTYLAASPGTLARIQGPLPKYAKRVNWQNGCLKVDFEPGNGAFQIHLVQIFDGACILDGRKYVGRPNEYLTRQIAKDIDWPRLLG